MSKRIADKELTRDNWDHEDPDDHEDMGVFKAASKDIIEKRVIRTAKRRTQASGDEPKKSVFSGFGGFNKTQPASFDFLSNLTNGNNMNGSSTKSDTTVTPSLFSSKPAISSSGLFAPSTAKPPFGAPPIQTSSPFASSASKTDMPSMTFGSKADSTVTNSAFKIQPVSSPADKTSVPPQVTSNIFGAASTSANQNATNSTFKQPVSSTSIPVPNSSISATQSKTEASNEPETEKDKAKNKYYSKLKGLNESVASWITKHVEKTPLCFLTPIFKDYENYLKELREEYESVKADSDKKTKVDSDVPTKSSFGDTSTLFGNAKAIAHDALNTVQKLTSENNFDIKPTLGDAGTTANAGLLFGTTSTAGSTSSSKTSNTATPTKGFSFGITSTPAVSPPNSSPFTSNSSNTLSAKGFSFGITSTPTEKPASNASPFSANTGSSPSSGFSFGTSTLAATSPTNPSPFSAISGSSPSQGITFGMPSTATSPTTNEKTAPAPFSFGLGSGKPFSFNSQVQQSTEPQNNENEEDEPPKVEYTPVVEENSVFDKRCKIFVKKDGNFADKGVGTLYIKKIEESEKHQLLVRANNNLGTVLLNFILSSGIPTQRMGKNNIMLVCIPTPDATPPPTPILIRVKTGEEADNLLEILNKHKS